MTSLARRWLLAAGLLVQTVAIAPAAGDERLSREPVSLPGGVADPAGRTGFVSNSKHGIDALDLETGKVLWSTEEASQPLVVLGKHLLAQGPINGKANAVRVVVLDIGRGKRLLESKPVVFPDWVSVGGGHGRSFASRGRIEAGNLLLTWEAHAWYAGGAAPTPEMQRLAKHDASGGSRVNLDNGRVEILPSDKVPAAKSAKLPRELEKATSQQYWTGSSWESKPLVVGDRAAALKLEAKGDRQKLALQTWELSTGKGREPVTLLEGRSLWTQLSLDRGHVFVHQALAREALPAGDYAWWVFSLETGRRVAKLPFEAGTEAVGVLGPRLYYIVQGQNNRVAERWVQPRTLKAFELRSGKLVWEHAVEGRTILVPLP
ncbi:MAG TPA: hypothetical protein VG013_03875 [Gemmataceae bacterium]|nr:hypothetical protein [Gemmataceae bacterium]